MTVQEQMKAKLEAISIPAKEIKVYGSQIMITAFSYKAACQWADVLTPLVRKMRCGEGLDMLATNKDINMPDYQKVWRVWGTV